MKTPYELFGKRAFDVVGSAMALLLFSVPMAIISLVVRRVMGSPVFFRQTRPGRHGAMFTLLKFRTMCEEPPGGGPPSGDGERITELGAFLRRSSLDELPELVNVFRGDMGLVGPRPLLSKYLDRYTPRQGRRHEVRPGMTGWAQVNGRNTASWEERLEMDVWYVDNWSLRLDLKILLMTVSQVLRREGISAEGHDTMPEFMGTAEGHDPN